MYKHRTFYSHGIRAVSVVSGGIFYYGVVEALERDLSGDTRMTLIQLLFDP